MTDRGKGSSQNVFAHRCYLCTKRASKSVVLPKEMQLSFSIVQFLLTMMSQIESFRSTNILHCTKRENLSANQVNGDYSQLKKSFGFYSNVYYD